MRTRLKVLYLLPAAAASAIEPAAVKRTLTVPVTGQPSREAALAAGPAVPVATLAFSPDGKLLAVAGYREVVLWDMAEVKLGRRIGPFAGTVRSMAFSPDGKVLAVADGVAGVSGAVRMVDLASGALSDTFEPLKDEIAAIALSPDNRFLLAGGADGQTRVWSIAEKKIVNTLKVHTDAVTAIAFSPDGKLMATGSADRTLQVWDVAEWRPLVQLPQLVTEPVTGVAFSPDNESLAFVTGGESERAVRVWRTEYAQEPKENDPSGPRIRANKRITRPVDQWTCSPLSVAANRTPRMYIGCSDKSIRVLNTTAGNIATLSGHQDWVQAVVVSPDGTKVASGSVDGTVKVWNRVDGALLGTLVQLAPRADEWALVTPRGFFTASAPGAVQFRGLAKPAADELAAKLLNADAVRNIFAGKPPIPPPPAPPKPAPKGPR